MTQACQACERDAASITEPCDQPEAPYQLCTACHRRLHARALRPIEWFNLARRFGCWQFLLHDDFYDEDGTATQPDEDVHVTAADAMPLLPEVAGSAETLLDFTITRWSMGDALTATWARQEPEDVQRALERRFPIAANPGVRDVILEVAAISLRASAATMVRSAWSLWPQGIGLDALARATAACLPHEEGFARATAALAQMSGREFRNGMNALRHFQSTDTLAWIEAHVEEPTTDDWGSLAGASGLDWPTVVRWLQKGRPCSLISIDALLAIARPRTRFLKAIQPVLLAPPSATDFAATLNAYATRDDVPRVRDRVRSAIALADQLCVPLL